ncbi:AAA domain (dynein-related subfamily) [Legionella busanensis]|uniref:AAA domain (Dynein-related subfamily) n=1 Tax=Legionella busanensis TaxID=190655 RepID=A0A378JS80_9GAMM|nr:AAA family ATPase [Legionella busanensis]STX52670.1 AAA domain (dynein-related subfamily) [Legionella busanensis]
MPYNPILYFHDKQESTAYSRTPQGTLSIVRLIKNLPAWKKLAYSSILKKKSLILADWTITNLSYEAAAALQKQILTLIDDGFPVYLWQDGDIKKLTKENVSCLADKAVRNLITPSFPEEISQKAIVQHRLTKDQVHILDDYWLNQLVLESESMHLAKRQIRISDLIARRLYYNKIMWILQNTTPALTEIIDDVFPNHDSVTKLNAYFPNLNITTNYTDLILNPADIDNILAPSISHHSFLAEQLLNIEHLKVEDTEQNMNATVLEKLLLRMPILKRLELSGYETLEGNFSNLPTLTHLEELYLSFLPIDIANLQRLLTYPKELRALTIDSCQNLEGNFTKDLNFTHLESLDITSVSFSFANLEYILSQANALKSLKLTHCGKNLADNFSSGRFDFSKIETLDLSNSNVSLANLQLILRQAKSLKNLRLDNYKELTKYFCAGVDLSALEYLDVSNSTITADDFRYILNQAHSLRALILVGCTTLDAYFSGNFDFSKLETLALTNSNISASDLNQILKQASALKELKLGGHVNLTAAAAIEGIYLPNLTRLYLSYNTISTPVLELFLNKKNNLGELNLANCMHLGAPFTQPLYLENLLTLNLSNSSITVENLQVLLQAAPQLKLLNIKNCKKLILNEALKSLIKDRGINVNADDSGMGKLSQPSSIIDHAKRKVDADTKRNPNQEYTIKRTIFSLDSRPSPDVSFYRHGVFNNLGINDNACSLADAFVLQNRDEPDLIPYNSSTLPSVEQLVAHGKQAIKANKEFTYYLGRQTITFNGDLQRLDSISASEEIPYYHVEPLDVAIKFIYSKRDNLYYIQSPPGKTVTVSFLLKLNQEQPIELSPSVEKINTLAAKFLKFGEGELDLKGIAAPTGDDYLRAMIKQEKGACRHRAVAFKAEIERFYRDLPVRIVDNQCHAFVEVMLEGQWVRYDLGGYPAKLTITESANLDNFKIAKYEQHLATWKREKPPVESVKAYCQSLMQTNDIKKRLVELNSVEDVQVMQLSLQDYCKHTSRPCFYINSPDDLICSAPFVTRFENKGELQKGPGGPLYDFLQAHRESNPPPVLIINYDHFDADDIVRFNSLLDKERQVEGINLPEKTLVLGLRNCKKPDCYQGADFYSRFNCVETPLVNTDRLTAHLNTIAPLAIREKIPNELDEQVISINLYNAPNWKDRLLGYWNIQGDDLYFIAGELEQAFAKGNPIELQNVPWDCPEFKRFWRQATMLGYIDYAGQRINVPKDLQLITSQGYAWSKLTTQVTVEATLSSQALVLNPGQLTHFFTLFDCYDGKLDMQPGLLDRYTKQTLAVNLTRDLSEDEWAQFLSACQEKHIKLTIHLSPNVTLPAPLAKGIKAIAPTLFPLNKQLNQSTTVITSTDLNTTLQTIAKAENDYQIIDVSECSPEDLLLYTKSEFDSEKRQFVFQQTKQALLQALDEGKRVILKGHFSNELIDALAPLLLARENNNDAKGQLILLSDKPCFSFLPTQLHQVTAKDKRLQLEKRFSILEINRLPEELMTKESLNQLTARLTYWRCHPTTESSDEAWQGLQGISGGVRLAEFNAQGSVAIAEEFNQKRLAAVNQALIYSPYVFLTGLTGVGKSTFVEKNFTTSTEVLYTNENKLVEWASDKTPGKRKILFIDEANLSKRQWSEFEGLMYFPPSILIKGRYYPLTEEHKVIFAGNPVNYGDERQLAPFFAEHGNALIFEPMPQEFIYEKLIKPVFINTPLADHIEMISQSLLAAYRFLCKCSTDEVLISPRDVQMMALLIASYVDSHPSISLADMESAAKHYAYQVAVNNVPDLHRQAFEKQFKPSIEISNNAATLPAIQDGFLVTSSRLRIHRQLDELLNLREFRQTKAQNKAQKYGGLGGLILEGEPGIGKSELVLASLRARGYEEVIFRSKDETKKSDEEKVKEKPLPAKPFYRMPVSLSLKEKEKLLKKAFKQGAVVVIDEINSSPMMERLLNDLLMGNNKQERPSKPGFLVIGTQNPVTMAGRKAASTALARRVIKTVLPTYDTQEMQAILISKGLSAKKAKQLVTAYENNVHKAKQAHLEPIPVFRDLINLAEQLIIAKQRKRTSFQAELNATITDPIKVNTNQLLVENLFGMTITKTQADMFIALFKTLQEKNEKINCLKKKIIPLIDITALSENNQSYLVELMFIKQQAIHCIDNNIARRDSNITSKVDFLYDTKRKIAKNIELTQLKESILNSPLKSLNDLVADIERKSDSVLGKGTFSRISKDLNELIKQEGNLLANYHQQVPISYNNQALNLNFSEFTNFT